MSNSNHFKVLIIGSGPAGLTAAIYAARANLEPLVLEGATASIPDGIQPGGQLMITTDVENYPGFPEGVTGPDMMDRFRKQAQRFGADCREHTVIEAKLGERPFTIRTEDTAGDEHTFTADSVIVSTGAAARVLGLPEEERLMKQGGGISACAVCDGALPPFRNQHLLVVGGGDTAMEEALFLTKFASKVSVIHRRDELRASKIMGDRAKANEKINFEWNTVIDSYLLDDKDQYVVGARLKDVNSGETRDVECAGVFLAIGHTPNTQLFKDQLPMDDVGYLKTHADRTATDIEGVYVCGDAQDPFYRQAVTAAGTGCMAALEAERWLAEKGIE